MIRPDKSRNPRRQLWFGYGLIFAVIVLGATSITAQFQHRALRAVAETHAGELRDLNTARLHRNVQVSAMQQTIASQQHELVEQRQQLASEQRATGRQEAAIAHLGRLRVNDFRSLTSLHNELAISHEDAVGVTQRLQQLEQSNAAARATINAAGVPAVATSVVKGSP